MWGLCDNTERQDQYQQHGRVQQGITLWFYPSAQVTISIEKRNDIWMNDAQLLCKHTVAR